MIALPLHYDYVAVYLTDRCPLRCEYCITEHGDTKFISGESNFKRLSPEQWIECLNRLLLPPGVPLTFQGGEPFAYPGVWRILDGIDRATDLLTALPRAVTPEKFSKLSTLEHLNRKAPYPNIRVSYHPGQNRVEDLVPRIKELQDIVSIGLYAIDHPAHQKEVEKARELSLKHGIFFKTKEFLGYHQEKLHGDYRYPDAVVGKVTRSHVKCKNSVLILGPDGLAYRCHSDLYHKRNSLAFGSILSSDFRVDDVFRDCSVYGTCSECDVKIKNNHEQKFGYTSVTIEF